MSAYCRLVVLALLCIVAGCNRGYPGDRRYPISGTVRVDGEPMELGVISFLPTDHSKQRVTGDSIQNGKYSVDEVRGANAGQYRVEISWAKKTGRRVVVPDTGDLTDERAEALPKRYNKESELTAEISAGKTTFDFDLKSK